MIRQFDLFEKFPDGSAIWRVCISGSESALQKLREMSAKSRNEFYAIDIIAGETIALDQPRGSEPVNTQAPRRHRKIA